MFFSFLLPRSFLVEWFYLCWEGWSSECWASRGSGRDPPWLQGASLLPQVHFSRHSLLSAACGLRPLVKFPCSPEDCREGHRVGADLTHAFPDFLVTHLSNPADLELGGRSATIATVSQFPPGNQTNRPRTWLSIHGCREEKDVPGQCLG